MLSQDCGWPPPELGKEGHCWPKDPSKYKLYKVTEYGSIDGVDAIKKEIYKRGPIGCGIHVTQGFLAYSGGIYHETVTGPLEPNHELSLVGFGRDASTGEDYWVGRNSWGTYWGESGFFRIRMGGNDNLGIETKCVWAVPEV